MTNEVRTETVGEFFKPLRRKIGLIVLVIALPFMLGWTRSISRFDWLQIDLGEQGEFFVMSQGQLLGVQCNYEASLPNVQWPLDWGSGTHSGLVKLLADDSINWTVRSHGCGRGNLPGDAGGIDYYVVPYSFIVIPMTMLSAYLLLSRPRLKKLPGNEHAISPPTSTRPDQDSFIAQAGPQYRLKLFDAR